MARFQLRLVIGLAGVAADETPAARRIGRLLEAPMLLMAGWILAAWYLDAKGLVGREVVVATDWVTWLFFVAETALLTWFTRDKARYLKSNWINLVIIAAGVPILWGLTTYAGALRSLRLLLMLSLLLSVSHSARIVLSRHHLGTTLGVSVVIIVAAGTMMAGIDPQVETIGDGLWWAWVTVTTVGYGDVVPGSPAGRLFGSLLILLGLGLFSLITASISAFLISREEERRIEEEEEILAREKSLLRIEKANAVRLERIEKRLEKLEDALSTLADAEHRRRRGS